MSAVYFHIPFCKSKCAYCNFFSVAGKHDMAGFAELLSRELELRRDYLNVAVVETIYFGGGTPSLFPAADIGFLIRKIKETFITADEMEVTLEANPEHLSPAYVQQLYDIGVNRISVGIQSLDDATLNYLGRTHNAQCALNAMRTLEQGPIQEISADLIFGIPGLTNELLEHEINFLTTHQIPHISTYALTVEDKTPLKHYIDKGKAMAPSESQAAAQYLMIIERLQAAGYEHYEISNFCLPGHHSRHNASYWDGTHYLGIGPSAHSFDGLSRQWNVAGIDAWLNGIKGGNPLFDKEILTEAQQFNEYIMTAIRTSKGIDLSAIEARFGKSARDGVLKGIASMEDKGWILHMGQRIGLTNKGKLFADRIAADLFSDQ